MANKDCTSNEDKTNVSVIESDISTPSQDSDRTEMAISSNSDEHKCIPGPVVTSVVTQTSSTGDILNTTSHVLPSQPSSPPSHEFYIQNPLNSPKQPTCDLLSADIALVGRMSSKVSEAESIELRTTNPCSPVEEAPLIQEATDTGASKILLPHSTIPMNSKGIVVPGTKFTNSASTDHRETAKKICDAVSQYYMEQFVDRWKRKTKQESSTITVVAALLVERNNKFRVVVLTAGTKIKYECSYFMKRNDTDESFWGLCDGHAEAMCYRLAGVYLVTEIYKLYDNQNSIFEANEEGYSLKKGIRFHLFTSHPPCGFMAKKERHFLSWKRPFVGKPHSLQCSSTILIGAYLGIQGPLSQWLVKPIYISSITMPRYETVETLHNSYIEKRFEKFQEQSLFLNTPEGQYSFHPPHVEIVDIDPCKLFQDCYRPYIYDEKSYKPGITPEEVKSNKKECTNRALNEVAGTLPDVIQNAGIHTLHFTVGSGIGSQKFRDSVLNLKYILVKLQHSLKEKRLKTLQEARVRLSQALNIKLALAELRAMLLKQIKAASEIRQKKADEIVELLTKSKGQPPVTDELAALYDDVKNLRYKDKDHELSKIVNSLGENVTCQRMLDDLDSLCEQGKDYSSDSEFYLDLMGCDWARYMETISKDVNCSIFD